MEKSLNVVEKISDQLYVITETESVHCYLVIGSDKAMLFDIGYGYENIMPLVRTITESFFGMTLQRCVKKQWITG